MTDEIGALTPRRAALGGGLMAAAAPTNVVQPGAAGHVVLLGDSAFDNKAYVAGGPDVVAQLRARLPPSWRASLGAVDLGPSSSAREGPDLGRSSRISVEHRTGGSAPMPDGKDRCSSSQERTSRGSALLAANGVKSGH